MKKPNQIDHIDPKWAEGRDYQLVCGLDTLLNYTERDVSLNSQKSNRFIPYRVTEDELGTVPIEQGDLCLFLDPDTNEWVLEEFLGKWWWDKSQQSDSRAQSRGPHTDEHNHNKSVGIKKTWETNERHRQIVIQTNKTRTVSEETRAKMAESRRLYWEKRRKQSI